MPVEFYEMEPPGYYAPAAVGQRGPILYRAFYICEEARLVRHIALVNEYSSLLHQLGILFQNYVDYGLHKRMAGVYERGRLLSGNVLILFVETYALVTLRDGFAEALCRVFVPNRAGDVGDFVAAALAPADLSFKASERFDKEPFYEVRLEFVSLHALHLFAYGDDAVYVHRVARQRVFLQQLLQRFAVQRVVYYGVQPCAHGGVAAVADGFYQQFAQRLVVKADFSEYVEYFPAQRLAFLFQLGEEPLEYLSFSGFV